MRSEHRQATMMKLLFLSSLVVFLCVAPRALAQNETTQEAVTDEEITQDSNLVTDAFEENVTELAPSRPAVIVVDEEPPMQVINNETLVIEGECPSGMYGKHCMYKCQCEHLKCDKEGFCLPGAQCVPSRFGDRCQESNMAAGSIREGITLLDGDRATCLAQGSFEQTVEFDRPLPISFIRIMYKNKAENQEFKTYHFKLLGKAMKGHVGDTHDQAPTTYGIVEASKLSTAPDPVNIAPIDEEHVTSEDIIPINSTTPFTTTPFRQQLANGSAGNDTDANEVRNERDAETNATAEGNNNTMGESVNVTEQADVPPASTIDDSNTTLVTLPPVMAEPVHEVPTGACIIEELDKPQELDQSMVSADYGQEYVNVELNQSVLVSGLTISGDNLENLCELYASGGVDLGPRGVFFERKPSYTRPVALHDRIYNKEDCVKGPGEIIFPEIVFDSNASFILIHVELELDWDYPNTAKKGMVTISNEDMSIVWKAQLCAKRKVIIGEPYARKSINQITIKGDNRLPPLCAVFVYGMCSPGYYGRDCEQRCSPYCSPDGCDPSTGVCRSCATGYFGQLCEKACPPGCKEGSRCHRTMGTCLEGCSAGRFPPATCDFSCSPGCAENGECDTVTRECKFGCKVGHFRKSCDMECKGCTGDGSCDIETGRCSAGCIQGYYGEDCKSKCSSDCEGGCYMLTGVCLGCPPGKTGDLCAEACNNCAGDGRCHQKDRTCIHGCLPGYKGVYCSEETAFAAAYLSDKPENLMMVGVVIAVGLVLLAVVIVAGVCTMKKKPEPPRKQNLPGSFGGMDKVSISPPQQLSNDFNISYEPIKDEYGTLV